MAVHSSKVAMVTSGGTGIGAAIVERLAADGALVGCCYNKSRQPAEDLARRLKQSGAQVLPVNLDVSQSAEVAGVVSFLASADASYITGEIIAVNGGMRMD